MMWPLLLCSLAVVAIAVERSKFLKQSKTDMQFLQTRLLPAVSAEQWDKASEICSKSGGIVGTLLNDAILQRSHVKDMAEYLSGTSAQAAELLRAQLNYLSAIVTLAPLMGLLGTVIGMIRSFDVLAVSEGQPFAITGGVAEALVATGFGLFVAIIAMFAHVWLSQWANRRISDIEVSTSLFMTAYPNGK